MKIVGIIFSVIFSGVTSVVSATNPIVLDSYTADPSAHVFHDTLWVYPSHDRSDAVRFDMEDYHVYSTMASPVIARHSAFCRACFWLVHSVVFFPFR